MTGIDNRIYEVGSSERCYLSNAIKIKTQCSYLLMIHLRCMKWPEPSRISEIGRKSSKHGEKIIHPKDAHAPVTVIRQTI